MSITRRFTPPTCTLEIEATGSTLSRWQKRKAIKDVQFQLSFDDPRLTEAEQFTIKGDRTQLEQLYQAVTNYIQNFLQQSSIEQFVSATTSSIEPNQPYLQPQGLIAHELFLGSLQNTNSGDKIDLSTIQLFDLVTALEDYQLEVAATVNPDSTPSKKRPLWITIAAFLIMVTGLIAVGFNLINRSSKLQTASSVQESAPSTPQTEPDTKNDVIPPQVTKSPEQPEKPKPTEIPLSSTEKLPPPPAVDLPKAPPTNVPDFSQYPLPKPQQVPEIESRIANQPQPTTPKQSEIAINSSPDEAENEIEIPDVPPLSPSLLPTEADITEEEDSLADDGTQSEQSLAITEPIAKGDSNEIQGESFSPVEPEESNSNLQLKEVKQYFQQRWQPPEQLKQTIEYRLVINSDGSIVRIIPIGKASEIFVDRTNIPLMGESFVTPNGTKGNQTIRLLLSPNGEVKTFLESK